MKVMKKLTTTVIGCVEDGNITKREIKDFNGGKTGKRIFTRMQKSGRKVFIDSVNTEKVRLLMPDEYVINSIVSGEYAIQPITEKENESE